MANVKTAISIQKSLFDKIEAIARQMQVSRSQIIAMAVRDFIQGHENRQLTEQLRSVYAGSPDSDEQEHLSKMENLYWETMEKEEW